jgi:hypothetical protein
MSFFVGGTQVFGATGGLPPRFTTTTRPESPVQGQVIFNTSINKLEMYDGSVWRETSNERPFLYRQIITTGYVLAGYRGGVPWRNVNRMVHSTDVCTNLGDQLEYVGAYSSGACSQTLGFIWAFDNSGIGSGTLTSTFNMATETSAGANSLWNLRTGRDDCGTVFKEHQYAYIIGGGTADIDIFNLTTGTMLQTETGPDSSTNNGSTVNDENVGYFWGDSGTSVKVNFATGPLNYTLGSAGNIVASHSQQKGINSKIGRGWAGNEGSYLGGYNLRRFQFSTETSLGTVSKPVANCGEENFDMGQAHQYMMGCYDGDQNNRGWKFTYASETGVELGAGSVRTGVTGASSGHCVWKG